jgi:hypothetical protein
MSGITKGRGMFIFMARFLDLRETSSCCILDSCYFLSRSSWSIRFSSPFSSSISSGTSIWYSFLGFGKFLILFFICYSAAWFLNCFSFSSLIPVTELYSSQLSPVKTKLPSMTEGVCKILGVMLPWIWEPRSFAVGLLIILCRTLGV